MMQKLERVYDKMLKKVLKYQNPLFFSVLGLFVISLFIMMRLGGEFIPTLPEGDFAVDTRVLPGSNLKTSTDAVLKSQQILLKKFPEIEKVVGKTGSSEIPTDPMPIDASDMMIILKPRKEWTSAKSYDELSEKMSAELKKNLIGVTYSFQYPVNMRFNELMTGARQDVVCKIFGENLDSLKIYADKLGEISKKIEGAENIYVEPISGLPQIVIEYNRAALSQYGLSIGDANKMVNTAFAGHSAGSVFEEEKKFDLVVRLDGELRKNLEDVKNLLIPTPNGVEIPLSAVAHVDLKESVNQIQREEAHRRIIVGFNVKNRDIQSTVTDLQKSVDKELKLPVGYTIKYGGTFENLQQAQKRLGIAVPVSLALILLLLYFAFSSVKYGLIIFTTIPLSAIGGILSLWLRGMNFSISAGVGFIALFGVAVLNGIVLIAEFNRQKEINSDLNEVVRIGGKMRLRPVLMTALVASLGFLPMALSQGEGAEVQRPLATVVIGGLLLATFLTLFILPTVYIWFEKNFPQRKKRLLPMNKFKLMKTKYISLIFFLLFLRFFSQTPISLEGAFEKAFQNNLNIKSGQLKVDYQQKIQNSAVSIDPLNINAEIGQINSAYVDNAFSVSQTVRLPKFYKAQKQVLTEQWKNAELGLEIQKWQLKREIALVYNNLNYLEEKEKLLKKADSIYSNYYKRSELRLKAGESNILEKTTAEAYRSQAEIQLQNLLKEREILIQQFNYLINDTENFQNEKGSFFLLNLDFEENFSGNPLVLSQLEHQKNIENARLAAEKAKLLPSFNIGINSTTMKGTGSDDKYYNGTHRFHSGLVGVALPVFNAAQKALIEGQKINQKIAENNYDLAVRDFKYTYAKSYGEYQKLKFEIDYYKTKGLKNAETILFTANLLSKEGEINYLEYTILVNQALDIQNKYIEAQSALNERIIELNGLKNN